MRARRSTRRRPASTASRVASSLSVSAPRAPGSVASDIVPSARQPLVLDAVRLVGRAAELLVAPLLVLAEVALEPAHLAVALERQNVGGDAVQEPAVVADHHDAARERLE